MSRKQVLELARALSKSNWLRKELYRISVEEYERRGRVITGWYAKMMYELSR